MFKRNFPGEGDDLSGGEKRSDPSELRGVRTTKKREPNERRTKNLVLQKERNPPRWGEQVSSDHNPEKATKSSRSVAPSTPS